MLSSGPIHQKSGFGLVCSTAPPPSEDHPKQGRSQRIEVILRVTRRFGQYPELLHVVPTNPPSSPSRDLLWDLEPRPRSDRFLSPFRYIPTQKSPPRIRSKEKSKELGAADEWLFQTERGEEGSPAWAGATTTAQRNLASWVARSGHNFMREMKHLHHRHLPTDWVVIVIVTLALAVFSACCWPWVRMVLEATR